MKKAYPVINNESAQADYAKKLVGFQEILGRLNVPQTQPAQQDQGLTLDQHLMQRGQPTHFAAKRSMARGLGMSGYLGKPEQDAQLLVGTQGQMANKQNQEKLNLDAKNSDREFGLKEKELKLKEQELSAAKSPTADEIAQSIISKSQ